jgi:FKBP-type peptidyl-prolyl cis-trans isomerase SlyD
VELKPGLELELHDHETDDVFIAYVAEINDDEVLIDFNHPLAGETLYFQVEVVGLRKATTEEIQHGHAHEDGHEDH